MQDKEPYEKCKALSIDSHFVKTKWNYHLFN